MVTKISPLTFRELVKRGYSLEGNTRIWNLADSKLWYLTPAQSQGYLDLDHDTSYKKQTGQFQAEELIHESIKEIASRISASCINVVDLGCGDGTKAAFFVNELRKVKKDLKIRYCPIDISSYMVSKAIETFSKSHADEIVRFQYNISDFENLENITPLLRNSEFKTSIFLLMGNTLGNFEIHELLYTIRVSMGPSDIFVVDTAVDDKKQEERAEAYRKSDLWKNWLIHIPLQLGLEKGDVQLGARFRNTRIEVYFTLTRDKEITFQDKTISFNKGDQIIILVAYKHNKEDLKSYLNMHFDNVNFKFSKDNSKVLATCSRA
jgi:uncharacterized SAM-dependent methyltransferase